jgi:hypothetical protein
MKRKPNLITKTEVARRLHQMVDERLFGNKPWPIEKESTEAAHTKLFEMGLLEYVPGMDQTCRNTPLGTELQVNLLEAFMGLWDEFELPEVLEMRGLLKKQEVEYLQKVLSKGAGWEQTFKDYVRRAYSAYYNPTQSLN